MKTIGVVLLAIGLALFIFVFYKYLNTKDLFLSPVPLSEGVGVIYVTPRSTQQ